MTRFIIGAAILFVLYAWAVYWLTAPNQSYRYHGGADRSKLQEIRP